MTIEIVGHDASAAGSRSVARGFAGTGVERGKRDIETPAQQLNVIRAEVEPHAGRSGERYARRDVDPLVVEHSDCAVLKVCHVEAVVDLGLGRHRHPGEGGNLRKAADLVWPVIGVILDVTAASMLSAALDRQALIVPSVATKTNFTDPEIVPIGTVEPLERLRAGPVIGNSNG